MTSPPEFDESAVDHGGLRRVHEAVMRDAANVENVERFTDLPSPARKKIRLMRTKVIRALFPKEFAKHAHSKRRKSLKKNQEANKTI